MESHLTFLLALLRNAATVSAEWVRTFQAAWISGNKWGVSLLIYLLLLFKRELDSRLRKPTWRHDRCPLPPPSPTILVVHFCSLLVHFSDLPKSNVTYSGGVPNVAQLQSGKWCTCPSVGFFRSDGTAAEQHIRLNVVEVRKTELHGTIRQRN